MMRKVMVPYWMSRSSSRGRNGAQVGEWRRLLANEPRKWELRTRMVDSGPSRGLIHSPPAFICSSLSQPSPRNEAMSGVLSTAVRMTVATVFQLMRARRCSHEMVRATSCNIGSEHCSQEVAAA